MESLRDKLYRRWVISLVINDVEEVPLPPGLAIGFDTKAEADSACRGILDSLKECGLPIKADDRPYGWVGYSFHDGLSTIWRCSVFQRDVEDSESQSSPTREQVNLV